MRSISRYLNQSVPVLGILLIAGCAQDHPNQNASTAPTATIAVTAAPQAASSVAPPAPPSSESVTASTTSAPQSQQEPTPPPVEPLVCSDGNLTIANGAVAEADTLRRVVVSFTNTSADICTLVGYPGADLVTAAGGVLVHVESRPANAAPRLTLHPGEIATADVQSYAIDTATGDSCGRIGTVAVTLPGGGQTHLLDASLPICSPTISAVG